MLDSLVPLINNLTMNENPLEKLTNHVFRNIIALSISLPISSQSSYSNVTIDHENIDILNIIDELPFYLDDYDVLNLPFLPCLCKIYKKKEFCDQCDGKYYSIRDFQKSKVYIDHTWFYGIGKTNFLETSDEFLNYLSSKDNNYFENWSKKQRDILHTLVDYISSNWTDNGEYDSKHNCSFPMKEIRFTYRINSY
jgi:hypothetical protein